MQHDAYLSPCERYRFTLTRSWGEGKSMVFVGLNPSTADVEKDDPTIRRCISFAQREGFNSLIMINLFAYRCTDPQELVYAGDPVGQPINDQIIKEVAEQAGVIVACWGAFRQKRAAEVCRLLGSNIKCFGLTKEGHPKHPLYLSKDTELIDYA